MKTVFIQFFLITNWDQDSMYTLTQRPRLPSIYDYSNMVRGFQAKLASALSFCCPSITKRDLQLDTKKTSPSPESHDAMSEYWCIERGIFARKFWLNQLKLIIFFAWFYWFQEPFSFFSAYFYFIVSLSLSVCFCSHHWTWEWQKSHRNVARFYP